MSTDAVVKVASKKKQGKAGTVLIDLSQRMTNRAFKEISKGFQQAYISATAASVAAMSATASVSSTSIAVAATASAATVTTIAAVATQVITVAAVTTAATGVAAVTIEEANLLQLMEAAGIDVTDSGNTDLIKKVALMLDEKQTTLIAETLDKYAGQPNGFEKAIEALTVVAVQFLFQNQNSEVVGQVINKIIKADNVDFLGGNSGPKFISASISVIDENETMTVVVTWHDNRDGEILQEYVIEAQDYESTKELVLKFQAADSEGVLSKEIFHAIAIKDVNESAVLMSVDISEVMENQPSIVTATWEDPEDGVVTVIRSLEKQDFETRSTADIDLSYTDSSGLRVEYIHTVSVLDVNEAASLVSVDLFSIPENELATIIATWNDPEDGIVTVVKTIPAQDYETAASVDVDLGYTDNDGLKSEKLHTVEVQNVNEGAILIDVDVDSTPENASRVITARWLDPEDGEVLVIKTLEAQNYETTEESVINLSYTDSGQLVANYMHTVEITDVAEYAKLVGISLKELEENQSGVMVVTWSDSKLGLIEVEYPIDAQDYEKRPVLDIPIQFTDSSGLVTQHLHTIQITNVNEPPVYVSHSFSTIDENVSGLLEINWLDQEDGAVTTTLGIDEYDHETVDSIVRELEYTDAGGLTASKTVTIEINDVNEAPFDFRFTPVFENGTYSVSLTATDPDDGDVLTVKQDGVVVPSGVVVYTVEELASNPPDTLLSISDSHGEEITILISPPTLVDTPGNDAPRFLGTNLTDIDENSDNFLVEISWLDPEDGVITTFHIIPANQDYESSASYIFTSEVTDSEGAVSSQEIIANIANVNEGAVIVSFSPTILVENAETVVSVIWNDPEDGIVSRDYTIPAQNYEATPMLDWEFVFVDSDGLVTSSTATFEVLNVNEQAQFVDQTVTEVSENESASVTSEWLDPEDGTLFVTTTVDSQDFETIPSFLENHFVIDSEGLQSEVETLRVDVLDVNEAPVFLSATLDSVNENEQAVITSIWDDPEDGIINITTVVPSQDFETAQTIDVEHVATDSDGLKSTRTLTLNVKDINESPTFLGQSITNLDENQEGLLITQWEDPEDGLLEVRTPISEVDYETESSITIPHTITDSGGISVTRNIVIEINDIAEGAQLQSISVAEVLENEAVTAILTFLDPSDGIITTTIDIPAQDYEVNTSVTSDYSVTNSAGVTTNGSFTVQVLDVLDTVQLVDGIYQLTPDSPEFTLDAARIQEEETLQTSGSTLHFEDGKVVIAGDHGKDNQTLPIKLNNAIGFKISASQPFKDLDLSITMGLGDDPTTVKKINSLQAEDDMNFYLFHRGADGEYAKVDQSEYHRNLTLADKEYATSLNEGGYDSGEYYLVINLDEPGDDNTVWFIEELSVSADRWQPTNYVYNGDFYHGKDGWIGRSDLTTLESHEEYGTHVDLDDGGKKGDFSQALQLEEGVEYVLMFDYRTTSNNSTDLYVEIGGNTIQDEPYNYNSNSEWATNVHIFTAGEDELANTLRFYTTTTSGLSPRLDNIQVVTLEDFERLHGLVQVKNGSFDDHGPQTDFAGNINGNYLKVVQSVDDWTTSHGQPIELVNHTLSGTLHASGLFLDLESYPGATNQTYSQELDLAEGMRYELSFEAYRQDSFDVLLNGEVLKSFDADTSVGDTHLKLEFIADAEVNVISFVSTGHADGLGTHINDVSVDFA